MKNKIIAHLKTIGTMFAMVGALISMLLLPQTVLLLTSTAILYWVLYDGFRKNSQPRSRGDRKTQ
jgi:hypothetical protein